MTPRRRHILSALVLLAAVPLLGAATQAGWAEQFDDGLARLVGLRQGYGSDAVIAFWQFVSWTGGGGQRYVIVAVLGLLLGLWHHWRSGVVLIVTSALANMVSEALKLGYGRLRPEIVPHLDGVTSLSFPSGHSASAALVYFLFAMLVPTARRGAWIAGAAILTIATGWSRIALGVHWATDVLGGWILGGSFALIGYLTAHYWEGRARWRADQHESL